MNKSVYWAKCGIGAIALMGLALADAQAQTIYQSETGAPGGSAHSMLVTFAKMARREGINIQVNAGKTLTRSMLSAGQGKIHFYAGVPAFYVPMSKAVAMYKGVKAAPAAAKNIRFIFSYPAGVTHVLVFANSGITTMKDFKGKKVFLGPPAGAATWEAKTIIKAVAGYDADKDYQGVVLNWGEGIQAMRDKKVDVLFRPVDVGSALIQQFGLNNSFRLITIPDAAWKSELIQKMLEEPDYLVATVEPNTYRGQKNTKPVKVLGFYLFIGTQAKVSADVVYKATKAFWNNLKEVHATAKYMEALNKKTALAAITGPLHVGAYRYYKEAGFDIPAKIVPPEAK